MSEIKKVFYDVTSPECNRDTMVFKPAIAFEVTHGLDNIAYHYNFPDGVKASEFEQTLDFFKDVTACYEPFLESDWKIIRKEDINSNIVERLQNIWAQLTALNPILETISIDVEEPLSLSDAICGVACLLNPRDIEFFIQCREQTKCYQTAAKAREIQGYAESYDRICTLIQNPEDDYPGWIVSPNTMSDIINQLDGQPPENKVSRTGLGL